jgi:hypothetical protein
MAEYIRFRWTRTKAGVTLAFLALLGGLVDRAASADAANGKTAATETAAPFFPRLTFDGLPSSVKSQFTKLDKDLQHAFDKVQTTTALLKHDVIDLKSDTYTKVETNSVFMKTRSAADQFLDKHATAQDSNELGGLGESDFIHGTGGIATGTRTVQPGSTMPLLSSSGGALIVTAAPTAAAGPAFTITNNGTTGMTWVATVDGAIRTGTLAAGATSDPIVINDGSDAGQATVQLLPAVQDEAFTLTVSALPGSGGGSVFVGQMVNGDG